MYDLVIYGGTSAAVSAAVQARRMGLACVVVSPESRIGGLTTGGLGQTDIGNKSAFGGLALEFYKGVHDHYSKPASWRWEAKSDYMPDGQCSGTLLSESMWTFEPSTALAVLEGWERKYGLEIVRGERLDRGGGGVAKDGDGAIASIRMESGRVFEARYFIDATYEGDLLAAAGVSYAVGREDNSVYGETLNGAQPNTGYHKLQKGIDPFVAKGDPSSGLLPGIDPDPMGPDGRGDARMQAYCFRMCLTDCDANRIPFAKPEGYDERDYELLFRNYEAGETAIPWINSRMPNRKTDTNNRTGVSTDFIGGNWDYAEASYARRDAIRAAHLKYQKGLMWTLANHPRVPSAVRDEVSRWGMCRDEFGPDGWQEQLYVREGRRMVSDVVMTERNCTGERVAEHPVALAAYTMDSHNVRRYVDADGFVQNEGDVEIPCAGPWPIDYVAIVPRRSECTNLVVPVCASTSHIAFGSIRMEPVFFALGQAAAPAVGVADGRCVQDVPYGELRARLLADGQVLEVASGKCR